MSRVTKLRKVSQVTKVTKLDILTASSLSFELSPSNHVTVRPENLEDKSSFPVLEGSFTGNLLVAMPSMSDQRFHRSVIYLCAHNPDGAMGIIINRLAGGLSYGTLMSELGIEIAPQNNDRPVFIGGPVEPTRGFILHTADHVEENTLLIENLQGKNAASHSEINLSGKTESGAKLALSSTTDMLRAIHQGKGPHKNILALGYAGWGPGQLESELQTNSWLAVDADEELIFGSNNSTKWTRALKKLGIDPAMLSSDGGRA